MISSYITLTYIRLSTYISYNIYAMTNLIGILKNIYTVTIFIMTGNLYVSYKHTWLLMI